jgi:hypothetical protein
VSNKTKTPSPCAFCYGSQMVCVPILCLSVSVHVCVTKTDPQGQTVSHCSPSYSHHNFQLSWPKVVKGWSGLLCHLSIS